jgi:hypothetical protein
MRDPHRSTQAERVRHQTELLALESAKRVTWQRLAAAADEYTEWQVFGLWLRAVVEVSGGVPAAVTQEMDSRTPQLLGRIRGDIEAAAQNGFGPGARIWQHVSQWVEINVFGSAARDGWLDAVQYFSAMSLCSMKAWSYWEHIDHQWRTAKPKQLPNYSQWKGAVDSVIRLSNPNSEAQQVLDAIRGVSEEEWNGLLRGFSDLIVFCLWMELVLDVEGPTSALLSKELVARYRGFTLPRANENSKECVRALNEWALKNALGTAGQTELLGALSFQVRHHPQYPAMRTYSIHCHDVWSDKDRGSLPSFDEWRDAGNEYCEE